jgi:hypothetical protein
VQLGLDVNAWQSSVSRVNWHTRERPTFLQQDPLEQRVLVPEHQTFVGGVAVVVLQVLQGLLMVLDSALELLDVLGAALAEGCLGLAVALLALLRGGIYLTVLG